MSLLTTIQTLYLGHAFITELLSTGVTVISAFDYINCILHGTSTKQITELKTVYTECACKSHSSKLAVWLIVFSHSKTAPLWCYSTEIGGV